MGKCMDTLAVAQSFAQAYAFSHQEALGSEIVAPEVTADAPLMEAEIDFTITGDFQIEAARKVVEAEKFENGTSIREQLPATKAELNITQQTQNTSGTTDAAIETNAETIGSAGASLPTPTSTFVVVQAPAKTSAPTPSPPTPSPPPLRTAPATQPRTTEPFVDTEVSGACTLASVAAWLLPVLMCAAALGEA